MLSTWLAIFVDFEWLRVKVYNCTCPASASIWVLERTLWNVTNFRLYFNIYFWKRTDSGGISLGNATNMIKFFFRNDLEFINSKRKVIEEIFKDRKSPVSSLSFSRISRTFSNFELQGYTTQGSAPRRFNEKTAGGKIAFVVAVTVTVLEFWRCGLRSGFSEAAVSVNGNGIDFKL